MDPKKVINTRINKESDTKKVLLTAHKRIPNKQPIVMVERMKLDPYVLAKDYSINNKHYTRSVPLNSLRATPYTQLQIDRSYTKSLPLDSLRTPITQTKIRRSTRIKKLRNTQ